MRAMKKKEKKIATFKGEERKKKEKERKERVGKNFLEVSLKEQRRVIEIYEIPIILLS